MWNDTHHMEIVCSNKNMCCATADWGPMIWEHFKGSNCQSSIRYSVICFAMNIFIKFYIAMLQNLNELYYSLAYINN